MIERLKVLPYDELKKQAACLSSRELCALESVLPVITLAELAEELGAELPAEHVLDFLFLLLKSDKQIIREGAALGLAAHMTFPSVQCALARAIDAEPSPSLKHLMAEQLECSYRDKFSPMA